MITGVHPGTMALVSLDSARAQTVRYLKKLSPSQGIALLTYKRDRGLVILCLDDHAYEVREFGFINEKSVVTQERIGRLLKTVIKREFPRSHKVRLLKLASVDELPGNVHPI